METSKAVYFEEKLTVKQNTEKGLKQIYVSKNFTGTIF